METLLFYVSIIFETIIVFHRELGSEHDHEDDRERDIDPSSEWLVDDHQDDTHASDDKRPLIHLQLLILFSFIICLLAPDKKRDKEKSTKKHSHHRYLCRIRNMLKNILKYKWNEE